MDLTNGHSHNLGTKLVGYLTKLSNWKRSNFSNEALGSVFKTALN